MGKGLSRPTPVGEVLASVLKDRGLEGGLSLPGLISDWTGAVGPGVAAHAYPEMLKGGVLTVIVDSSPWMNQLSLLRFDIIKKVNASIGEEAVSDLRFRIGAPDKSGAPKAKAAPFVPKRRSVTETERAEIEDAVEQIPDPALRASARRLMLRAKSRVK
jgi:hypothetical protein